MNSERLFGNGDMSGAIEGQRRALRAKIDALTDRELGQTDEAISAKLWEEFKITPIALGDDITVEKREGEIDLRRTNRAFFLDRDDNPMMQGAWAVYRVPFTGEEVLLGKRPSTFDFNPPHAEIARGALLFSYPALGEASEVKALFDRDLTQLRNYVENQRKDVEGFMRELPTLIESGLAARRKRQQGEDGFFGGLGYPRS